VQIFGDYYWKELPDIEKALDAGLKKVPIILKNDRDIEKFVN
jgi:hypothetical protein